MGVLNTYDFTGTNGAAWPTTPSPGFANAATSTGSSATIQTNRGRINAGSTTTGKHAVRYNTSLTGSGIYTKFTYNNSTGEAEVWLRGPSAAYGADGYFLQLQRSGGVNLYETYSGGNYNVLGTKSITLSTSTEYALRFYIDTSWNIKFRVWATAGGEPGTWDVEYTDTNHRVASGYILLQHTNTGTASTTIDFDDVTITDGAFLTDATVAATTVARSAAIPAPTIINLVSPATVAGTGAVPAPTVSTALHANVTPATIARAAVIPAPTVFSPDARPVPSVVAGAVAMPAPVVSISHTVPVAPVARAAVLPAPLVQVSTTVTPPVISLPSAVPAPNVDVVSAAPVHLLTDTFSFEDTGKWTGYAAASVGVSLGNLQIDCISGGSGLTSIATFSLNGSETYIEVPQVTNVGNGGTKTYFGMEYGSGANAIAVYFNNGNLYFLERVSSVDSTTSVTYDATAHRWWKISKSSTTVTWYTSPDGITWTPRRTKTTTLNPNLANVVISSSYTGTEPSPGTAQFDNLSTPAIVVLPPDEVQPDIGWWLEAYDLTTGELQASIFNFTEASFLDPIGEVGNGTFKLPSDESTISDFDEDGNPQLLPNGRKPSTLYQQAYYWYVFDNGARRFRFISEVNDAAKAKPDLDDSVTIAGPGHATVLSWGVVLPADLAVAAQSRVFLGTNWAKVWLTLFREAQIRGAIPSWVVPTFDEYIDSNGVPWVDYGDYEAKPGQDLLALLNQFQGNIGFQWRLDVNGFLKVALNIGVDRSSTVRFFEGSDIWEAEDHTVGSDVKSDVYIERGDGFISSASDTTTRTDWGRRELYLQASSALGDLSGSVFAQGTLAQVKKPVYERNFVIDPFPKDDNGVSLGRRVYVDYEPGDFIGYNARQDDGSTDYRLISVAIKVDSEGAVTQEITVNSRREALAERIRRVLEQSLTGNYSGATGGSPNDLTGGSTALNEAVGDTKVPDVPTFNTITSSSSLGDDGIERAQLNITWYQPTNTDMSAIVDGDHYEIGYRILGAPDYEVVQVGWDTLQTSIDGLAPNTSYQVRIRAVDKANPTNYGAWSSPTTYLTVIDTTAPTTPAAPSCATSLIAVQITHTLGRFDGGTYNMDLDLDHFEIHAGTVFNFATSPSTLIGKLPANRGMIVGNIPAIGTFPISQTTLMYFKVIAVDKTGNRSAASGSASATATLIDNQHVSDLSASKITAGTITSNILLSGSIKTATSGARTEIDINGIRLYNSSGGNTVNLDATSGSATITGTFQTGASGQRIIIDPTGNGTIYFKPASGTNFAFINAPSSNSIGVNSGNSTGFSTRLYVLETAAYLHYIDSAQDLAGGQVYVDASHASMAYTTAALVNVNSGGAAFNVGTYDITLASSGAATINCSNLYGNSDGTVNINGTTTLWFSRSASQYVTFNSGGAEFKYNSSSVLLTGSTVELHGVVKGYDIGVGSVGNTMILNTPTAQIYYLSSSEAVKSQIEDVDREQLVRNFEKLRPVTFYDRKSYEENGGPEGLQQLMGLVAEEVKEVDYLGKYLYQPNHTPDGDAMPPGVLYDRGGVPILVAMVQHLLSEIREIKARMN